MLAQITPQMKVPYAPVDFKFVSYAPVASRHPLYLRVGAVFLPSNAERFANFPSRGSTPKGGGR